MRVGSAEEPVPSASRKTASASSARIDWRSTYRWVPSETTWKGAAAPSLAVLDRNGSSSSSPSRSAGSASTRPPRLTTGIRTAPATA